MKRLLLAGLLAAPVVARGQVPLKAFAVGSEVSMRVYVPGGKVKIVVWDRDSLVVTGSVARGAHLFAGGSGLSAKLGVDWDDRTNTALPKA
ncbi:MAG: hypothetical protein ABUL71_03515, partial [Gemmatimonadota bacterium]